eukprot:CAMPEP_0171488080 /NCGR_PEP_ID=MMETSP0958-20121227/2008_1 /TAXON_ID=87120 /ORGANISM="Aurantiochytrium limacinum, Strain ATCCMYA-1381" /LENGTH=37 /DNA_ID= /DNA_START= /DNA_END= /DNA_ORIENTATION=
MKKLRHGCEEEQTPVKGEEDIKCAALVYWIYKTWRRV